MAYQGLARRLKFLAQSLRRHGPGHVIEVFRQAAVRRRYARAPIAAPRRDELFLAYGVSNSEQLITRIARSAARNLPMTLSQRKEFSVSLIERSQGYDAILEEAERFTDGRFLALGISTLETDGDYDWHRDYGSSKVWDRVSFDRVRYMDGDGSDVKFPWELSRHYWISWLGKAYWISSNSVWSREFVRQIDSWRLANPVNIGVNWSMPMEVGIRGFWLTMGFGMFQGAPNIDTEWWTDYLCLVWAHGTYLENNLEYFSNLTNHYIANCFGLVAIGSIFAETDQGYRWLIEGRRRLESEINHQVLDDGTHYERSLPYHRLVLEIYLIALVLLERVAIPFTASTRAAIERMSELLCDVMLVDGTIPHIGDADDGVVLRTTQDSDRYDARDVAGIAAVVFERSDFARAAGRFTQGAIMMTGGAGFESFRALGRATAPPPMSRIYRSGGFAVLRSRSMFVVADCGPIGLHGNNDALSFVLSDRTGALVVDPGTYCYTRNGRLRNELRSTAAHNAPSIDGAEIADFDGLWRVRADRTNVTILHWSDDEPQLRARHSGYAKLGVSVTREFSLTSRDELTVVDTIDGDMDRSIGVRFTLAQNIEVSEAASGDLVLMRDGVTVAHLKCSVPIEIVRGWYSPSYGVAVSTFVLVVAANVRLPTQIRYIWSLHQPTESAS